MKDWKKVKLGEIAEIVGGGTPKTSIDEYWNGNIPWLSVNDFNNGRKYCYDAEKKITEAGLYNSSTKLLPKNSIIISARGTVGVISVLGEEMAFNQSCYGLNGVHAKTTNDFLYYLLKANVPTLVGNAYGAVFDTIVRKTLEDLDILLPPLPIQERIAEILSSLDDKIDLLHRQNKTLEDLAQTLFRKYFIQDAKEEWEEKSLYDMIVLVGGGTPKTEIDEYWNGDTNWISAKDITPNHRGFILETEKKISIKGLNNSSTKILPKFSTIISARGTVGKYSILAQPMAFSQSNYGILPKGHNNNFFVYLLLASSVELLQASAYGTVFDTITTNTFKDLIVSVPDINYITKFEKIVEPFFEKIFSNSHQLRTLTRLRDELLPKLMRGECLNQDERILG